MSERSDARARLAVPLDVPSLADASAVASRLSGRVGWLKVGLELFVAEGPAAVAAARDHARVFLDLKLHDIPNTVAGATAAAARTGAALLTLHTAGGRAMLAAARAAADEERAARGSAPALIGVTVLTSLGDAELKETGIAGGVSEQVARMVDLALETGLDGVVVSPHEAAETRRRAGAALRIVTPGIRPASAAPDDQRRLATPGDAIRAGSDLLVVGRPILQAPDPAAAADAVVAEIAAGLAAGPAPSA